MDKPTALTVSTGHELSAFEMMSHLIAQGADLDKIEKALKLQEKWEEAQAKKAYYTAMAAFKANPPDIYKTQSVDYTSPKGRTAYQYADLGETCALINAGLSTHGLSAAWSLSQPDGKVCVTCTITHNLGHSQSVTLCGPPDTSGGKDSLKAIGSAVSYLERYTLLSLTGIAAKAQDPEMPPEKPLTAKQLSELLDIADSRKVNKAAFLKQLGLATFEEIPGTWFTQARADLLSLGVDP